MLAETRVLTGSLCRSPTVVPPCPCCTAPAMGTPVVVPVTPVDDGRREHRVRHVEEKGPDRMTAASRREAQRGSRPPTGVGAVVREGDNQLAPGGTMHPARTSSRLPPVTGAHTARGGSVEAAVVLLQGGVDGERRGDDHAGQGLGQPV